MDITDTTEPAPLFDRAMNLMGFMDEQEAAAHLVSEGVDGGEAFLAVKAASMLLGDPTGCSDLSSV